MMGLIKHAGRTGAMAVVCGLVLASSASAYISTFEGLTASAAGVVLAGQDGWTLPSGTDYFAFTYAGNTLGVPQNLNGGEKFIGTLGPGGALAARAQHAEPFPASGQYFHAFDFCPGFTGTPPAVNNVGSFSMNVAGNAPNDYIALCSWVVGAEGALCNLGYLVYDAAGVQALQPGLFAGPAWQNLAVNRWYRATAVVIYDINQVLEVRITDIAANSTSIVDVSGSGWYLEGGAAGSTGLNNQFRFFTGGATAGNIFAIDNPNVSGQATPVAPATWGGIKATFATTSRAAAPRRIGVSNPAWPLVD